MAIGTKVPAFKSECKGSEREAQMRDTDRGWVKTALKQEPYGNEPF